VFDFTLPVFVIGISCLYAGRCGICHVNRLYRKQVFLYTTPRFKTTPIFYLPLQRSITYLCL